VQLYPALDLRGGALARTAIPPDGDPLTLATRWRAAGATWIHIVDMDRALGTGDNTSLVRRLVSEVEPPLQIGGAPATAAAIEEPLGWGASRVVAGVGAIRALADLVRQHGLDRLAVALDVRDGMAVTLDGAVAGNPLELLASIWDAGVRTVVYRDLGRDGTLSGAAFSAAHELVGRGADIVLAGGFATLDELRAARDGGFAGAIVGRALLEGKFSVEDALTCCG
jgi:phosphoribosylformimino-5-aminoimidazole carboxamide ribonucleotide (ProFAR) isomerase